MVASVHAGQPQSGAPSDENQKRLAYLVSDLTIPFWEIMDRGVRSAARELGYQIETYSAANSAKSELEHTVKAIRNGVDGLIISPTNSSAAVTLLTLAQRSDVPVVIADIGADSGEYVSYISSDNHQGAYEIGKVLTRRMLDLGWQDGRVGIIAIPQKRANGQARTAGFMQALEEAGIKGADLHQQVTFSYRETYAFAQQLIDEHPDLHAIWLQGSDKYQGALDAISDAGKLDQVLLICFDAEPIFLDLIPQGVLVGAAMQQPYLMGQEAVRAMDAHLQGKSVQKNLQLPVLAISADNIAEELPVIKRNVLGIENESQPN
jgi:ABC-type sugar transport system substrate-binding protein